MKIYTPEESSIFIDFLLSTKYVCTMEDELGVYVNAEDMVKFIGSSFISPTSDLTDEITFTMEFLDDYIHQDPRNRSVDLHRVKKYTGLKAKHFKSYGSMRTGMFVYASETSKWVIKDGEIQIRYGPMDEAEYLKNMNIFHQLFKTMKIKRVAIFDTKTGGIPHSQEFSSIPLH